MRLCMSRMKPFTEVFSLRRERYLNRSFSSIYVPGAHFVSQSTAAGEDCGGVRSSMPFPLRIDHRRSKIGRCPVIGKAISLRVSLILILRHWLNAIHRAPGAENRFANGAEIGLAIDCNGDPLRLFSTPAVMARSQNCAMFLLRHAATLARKCCAYNSHFVG
jgi:hypothetical protein